MPILHNVPIPLSDAIAQPKRAQFGKGADPQEGKITQPWVDFFTQQGATQDLTPTRVASVPLTQQNASIGATDMTDGALNAGLYRVTWYARITQAAGVSSSLTVTIDWVDDGVAVAYSGAAITGNTTSTFQSETKMFYIDGASAVRYSTTYASNAAGAMTYKLLIALEAVNA